MVLHYFSFLVFTLTFSLASKGESSSKDPTFVSLIPTEFEELISNGSTDKPLNPHEIVVFSENNIKSKTKGKIVSSKHGVGSEILKVHFERHKEEIPFKPNLVSGFCESSYQKILFRQSCESTSDEWCNLGKGPWGEAGWVNLKPRSVFDPDLRFTFGNYAGANIQKDEKGIYNASGFDRTNHEQKDGILKREELIDSDGKLKIQVDCKPYSC